MKLNDILNESLGIQEDTVGQLASKLMAIFRGTAYEYALKLMKEKGLDAHDAAKVVDGVDARVLAQMVSANESLELTEAPGMIRGVLAALALTAGLAATGPDALEWADQLPDEAKAELQAVIDSGNTAALDKFKAKYGISESVQEGRMKDMLWDYAEQMDREEFVANAMEFGMSDEEAAEFWDNCNGDLGAEMAKYEESINYMKKLAGL